jgi:hypothetical protein
MHGSDTLLGVCKKGSFDWRKIDEQSPQKVLHSDADVVFVFTCLHGYKQHAVEVGIVLQV